MKFTRCDKCKNEIKVGEKIIEVSWKYPIKPFRGEVWAFSYIKDLCQPCYKLFLAFFNEREE